MGMQTNINSDAGLTAQHTRLLEKFGEGRLWDALAETFAGLWIPGQHQKFHGPRLISGTRPVAVTLEVKSGGGLVLSGAVSRADKEVRKLVYSTIFSYDFTQPMRPDGKGATVTTKNQVVARCGLSLLNSLVRFGERRVQQPRAATPYALKHPRLLVPFNPGDETFDDGKLEAMCSHIRSELRGSYKQRQAQEFSDRTTLPGSVLIPADLVPDSIVAQAIEEELAYEDYSPVLGVPHWNPAANLREQRNPAKNVLKRHGITDLNAVDEVKLSQLMAEVRMGVLLGEKLSEYEVMDALAYPDEPVSMEARLDQDDAFTAADAETRKRAADRLVKALRVAAGSSRAAREATDEDLLAAAQKPSQPLVLSRLSKTQICHVREAATLPSHYAGDFLSPVDWTPRPRGAAKTKFAA
jgi:hypothetical protein